MAPMEYLNILVVTFNCARQLIKPEIFARHLSNAVPSSQRPDIIVLSLQEVAPIAYSFLGGSHLLPYFVRFRHAVEVAAKALSDTKYVNIVTRNVGMTACMVFVLERHQEHIQWIETGGVGVGVHEMGNKGAVGSRLGYAVSEDKVMELTFVAAHLAAMEDALKRRNEDWMNIVRGLVLTPIHIKKDHDPPKEEPAGREEESESLLANNNHPSKRPPRGIYSPTSHFILAGDLNYHPHHYSHLLQNDQLSRERKASKTCHDLSEAPITFPPTYKYSNKMQLRALEADDTMATTWDWAKHRWPSWCDRILYLDVPEWMRGETEGAGIEVQKYDALPLNPTSDHRPVVLAMRVPLKAIPMPEEGQGGDDVRLHPPFDVDPLWRERRKVARRKEILVGLLAYLFLTWEGNGILVALVIGVVGGWAIVRSMLEV